MRFVAVLIVMISAVPASPASAGPVHGSPTVRPTGRRSPLLTITRLDHSTPASPSRREPALESALDEEESSDFDTLDPAPRALTLDPFASLRLDLSSPPPPQPSPTHPRRPGLLRC